MSVEREIAFRNAKQVDVALVAIKASSGLRAIVMAIRKAGIGDKEGAELSLQAAESMAEDLSKDFNRLTGWKDE